MILRIIIYAVVIYLLFKLINTVKQIKSDKNEKRQQKSTSGTGEDLVEDPVCHTYVPVSQAYKKEISGKDYYFCGKDCAEKYTLEKK